MMDPLESSDNRIASLESDIQRQREIVADCQRRGDPLDTDERLLSEMESALFKLHEAKDLSDQLDRLRTLAVQCRNQASSVARTGSQQELRRMAEEYEREVSKLQAQASRS